MAPGVAIATTDINGPRGYSGTRTTDSVQRDVGGDALRRRYGRLDAQRQPEAHREAIARTRVRDGGSARTARKVEHLHWVRTC